MFIANLKLWNFRKFGSDRDLDPDTHADLNLDFTKGLNVIIGENDSGKSAIIDAIKIVLKTHSYEYIRIDDKDFYKETSRFRIELRFEGLVPVEAKNFTEWLAWSGAGKDAVPYLRVVYDVSRRGKKILPSDVKAGPDPEGSQLNAEAREYLKATYLKPLRDAESELIAKRNSRLSQILLGDPAFKAGKDHELVAIFETLRSELKKYFKGEFKIIKEVSGVPTDTFPLEGKQIKEKIDGYIKGFYGEQYETAFDATSSDIKSILEMLTLQLLDEAHPGLGTLNRLFMAAELLHLNKENWTGLRLGLIEELEAHLHPQAQMQIIEALQNHKEIQLILTSHSPNLVSKVKLENVILCHNAYAFPLGKPHTKLRKTDYPFLERFLDVTKSNLFFAKGVIIVEGAAEEMIVPALAKKMCALKIIPRDLTAANVSVVAINNTAFSRYGNIFQRMRFPYMTIPVAILNDLDLRPVEYAAAYKIKAADFIKQNIISSYNPVNHLAMKAAKLEGQSVKTFISGFWTLEYCIALHPYLRKLLFTAIQHAIEENRADNYAGPKESKRSVQQLQQAKIDTAWTNFISGKAAESVAFDLMYEFIVDQRKLSKAVIAQYFAVLLIKDQVMTKADFAIANNPIQYIFDAISYATGH
jgi:putative ATP-dependent endonuclease of OLD family